jgi:hypothetical protein
MSKLKRRIAATSIAALTIAGFTVINAAGSASAATSCIGSWATYTTKTLSTSWSYAGSTARVTGVNYYQLRSYCGIPQYRSVLKLTAAQGAYTKATNASVRWSNGGHSSTFIFPATLSSPTSTQTTSVAIGFKNTRYGAATSKIISFG